MTNYFSSLSLNSSSGYPSLDPHQVSQEINKFLLNPDILTIAEVSPELKDMKKKVLALSFDRRIFRNKFESIDPRLGTLIEGGLYEDKSLRTYRKITSIMEIQNLCDAIIQPSQWGKNLPKSLIESIAMFMTCPQLAGMGKVNKQFNAALSLLNPSFIIRYVESSFEKGIRAKELKIYNTVLNTLINKGIIPKKMSFPVSLSESYIDFAISHCNKFTHFNYSGYIARTDTINELFEELGGEQLVAATFANLCPSTEQMKTFIAKSPNVEKLAYNIHGHEIISFQPLKKLVELDLGDTGKLTTFEGDEIQILREVLPRLNKLTLRMPHLNLNNIQNIFNQQINLTEIRIINYFGEGLLDIAKQCPHLQNIYLSISYCKPEILKSFFELVPQLKIGDFSSMNDDCVSSLVTHCKKNLKFLSLKFSGSPTCEITDKNLEPLRFCDSLTKLDISTYTDYSKYNSFNPKKIAELINFLPNIQEVYVAAEFKNKFETQLSLEKKRKVKINYVKSEETETWTTTLIRTWASWGNLNS